jgi:hypothetical protein
MSEEFRRDFQKVAESIGSALAGQGTQDYVTRVEGSIDLLVGGMVKLADNQKSIEYAKGDVFEAWHAGTLNLDSVRQHLNVHALAPRDTSIIDVQITGPSGTIISQLKDYKTATDTAKAISDPKYLSVDHKIVPSDQLDGVREAADRLTIKNQPIRPDMASNYSHTARVADDQLHMDGASSKPISEPESRHITQQARATGNVDREGLGLTTSQVIQWEDFLRETSTAAMRAAALSAALQLAPHIVALVIKGLKTGKLTLDDLTPIGKQIPMTAIRSGLSGGLSASIIAAARMGALGAAMKDLDPTMVAAGVTLAITTIGTSIKAAQGTISWPIAAKTMAEDTLVLSCAMGGAIAGQAAIPIPLLGAIIGNIVGAVIARLVIAQTNNVVLGVAVETGWTFFGIVDQDYTIPNGILLMGGWELLEVERLQPDKLCLEQLHIDRLEIAPVPFQVLRRGVISFGKIGYAV